MRMKLTSPMVAALAALATSTWIVPAQAAQTISAAVALSGPISESLDSGITPAGTLFAIKIEPPYPSSALQSSTVYGHVAWVQKAGQGTNAGMSLSFDRIQLSNGHSYPIHASLLADDQVVDKHGGRTVAVTAAGMGVGNMIAKTWGGSAGGAAGAAAGFLLARNHRDNFHIPQGSIVRLQLTQALSIP
jgi:hypothetical protein